MLVASSDKEIYL